MLCFLFHVSLLFELTVMDDVYLCTEISEDNSIEIKDDVNLFASFLSLTCKFLLGFLSQILIHFHKQYKHTNKKNNFFSLSSHILHQTHSFTSSTFMFIHTHHLIHSRRHTSTSLIITSHTYTHSSTHFLHSSSFSSSLLLLLLSSPSSPLFSFFFFSSLLSSLLLSSPYVTECFLRCWGMMGTNCGRENEF